jgi:hypothetical protein
MRWTDPDWRAEAEAWIRDRVEVAGAIEQPRILPWSTVLRVPTAEGDVWFKAVAPIHAFEPALSLLLAKEFADRVTEVFTIDVARRWMLMRDSGTRLRELDPDAKLRHWEALLPRYAEIQIALAPRADELLALGVPDERLAGIPDKIESLLDDDEALLIGESTELTAAQRDELRARMPELRELVDELAAYGIPETIQHDDLHDGQVFVQDGRLLASDWGDSCVSHPFHTLTVVLRAIAWRHELPPGSDALVRLRDAYLEPFAAPPAAGDLAYRTGTLARALAWHRYVQARPPEQRDREDLEALGYGFRLFVENGPIGTWE